MENKHKVLLRENRVQLVRELFCDPVLMAHLRSNNTLTDEMEQEVLCEKGRGRQASTLLDILVRRGAKAFPTFCGALMVSGQGHLCIILDKDMATNLKPQSSAKIKQPSDTSEPLKNVLPQPKVLPSYQRLPSFDNSSKMDDPMAAESSFMNVTVNRCALNGEVASLFHSSDVYTMSAKTRGRVVIFCNTYFTSQGFTEREGANFDLVNLDTLFSGLSFSTKQFENKTAKEMKDIILEESQNPDNDKADSLILFFMTHGTQGKVYGIDGISIDIDKDIAARFDATNCQALKQKPKLVFIQACQGEAVTEGIPQSGAGSEENAELIKKLEELSLRDTPDSVPSFQSDTHEKADFLMAYSTVPGYKSWRRADLGSWFVRAICHVFSTYAHKEHITELLTRVRKIVAEQKTITTADKNFLQITETRDTLTKKFYFFPGLEVEINKDH